MQTERSVNWNAPSVSPVWFNEDLFDPDKDFSAEQYVDDVLRYVPLDTLHIRLVEYAEELRGKLVELVNQDYDEFATLSTRLVNVESALQELELPLCVAKAHVERVRLKLNGHLTSLNEAVRRRQKVAELRNSLELSRGAAQSLANVEALVRSLSELESQRGKQDTDDLCKNLDRICGELGRLLYVVRVNNMNATRTNSLKEAVEARLESALIIVIDEQEPSCLGTLLHAFSTVECVASAEGVVRLHLVEKAVRNSVEALLKAQSSPNSCEMLYHIVSGLKREVWSFLEAAMSICGSALPFDFIGASVLPEVLKVLEAHYPTMYTPGNPSEFQRIYMAFEEFFVDLERLCTSKEQLARFRSSPARKVNRSKWHVAAYFSLRFQEIASSYENCLKSADIFLSDGDMSSCVTDCIMAMRSCLAPDVFLPPVADKLIRLQLQLFARFIDWVREVISFVKRENDATSPGTLAAFYAALEEMDAPAALLEDAADRLGQVASLELILGAYQEAKGLLDEVAKELLDIIADAIASTCVESLGQIRGILAALRMTMRMPTAPAQYPAAILKPLQRFLDENSNLSIKDRISKLVISRVALDFRAVTRQTLDTATRTEESLKKLRSRKERIDVEKDADEEPPSMQISELMSLQLRLDAKEFKRLASDIVDISEVTAMDSLIDSTTLEHPR
jgi:hypothetical protein